MKENRVLAINPGTGEIGAAVLADTELLYYGVKILRARKPAPSVCSGAARITHRLITAYQPQAIALIRPLVIHPGGKRLVAVIREIKRLAQDEGVAVYEYAPKTIRQFICGSKRATRGDLARVTAARYPELSLYAKDRSIWEEMYYARMFMAVAAGLADYYNRGPDGSERRILDVLKPAPPCKVTFNNHAERE